MKDPNKTILGITMGDMNGIGPEIILKIFSDSRMLDMCIPVIYGSTDVLEYYSKELNIQDLPLLKVSDSSSLKKNKINVINCQVNHFSIETGKSTKQAGELSFKALELASKDILEKKIDVLVTGPINKKNVREFYENFSGHTGYLSDVDGNEALMVLCSNKMRIAMVTGHMALSEVKSHLSTEKIVGSIEKLNKCLKSDFGINKPKIAVLGLNPHSGEEGLMGNEEIEIIGPAIAEAKTKGIIAIGPYPSDGFFGAGTYSDFDGVLAMYHDQALIPFKTLSFEDGINYTAGLSFIRTSPDHGTAYDISGSGKASESSMRAAMFLAIDIFKRRSEEIELSLKEEA